MGRPSRPAVASATVALLGEVERQQHTGSGWDEIEQLLTGMERALAAGDTDAVERLLFDLELFQDRIQPNTGRSRVPPPQGIRDLADPVSWASFTHAGA